MYERDRVKKAEEAEESLKATIREANGVINDLTRLIKQFHSIAPTIVEDAIKEEVERHMTSLKDETDRAIQSASQAVINRFDTLAATLLGENRSQVRRGEPSIPMMVEALVEFNEHKRGKRGG